MSRRGRRAASGNKIVSTNEKKIPILRRSPRLNLNFFAKSGRWSLNGVTLSIEKLIAVTKKNTIFDMRVKYFNWCMEQTVWHSLSENGRLINISPAQVVREKLPRMHYDRILAADLYYPVILGRVDGSLHIIDGNHRLAKAVVDQVEKISCIYATNEQLEASKMV